MKLRSSGLPEIATEFPKRGVQLIARGTLLRSNCENEKDGQMLKGPILTLAAAALLAAPFALAEEKDDETEGHQGRHMEMMQEHTDTMGDHMEKMGGHLETIFGRIDADGNGEVTQAELDATRAARVAEIDSDGDGNISADELIAARAARLKKQVEQRLAHLDSDGDGLVSVDEYQATGEYAQGRHRGKGRRGHRAGRHGGSHAGMIMHFDADEDGAVSLEEFKSGIASTMGRHGNRMRKHYRDHGDQNSESDES